MTRHVRAPHAATPLPHAEIVHEMPGRARLRITSKQGDAVFFAAIASGLSAIAGVYDIVVKPLTGSILIQHSIALPAVCAAAKEAQLFDLAPEESAADGAVVAVDPKVLVALCLGVMSVWQFAKGRALPHAVTLLWYASCLGGVWPHGAFDASAISVDPLGKTRSGAPK
jgi:hypothetical protein